jgi:hypothetical protein
MAYCIIVFGREKDSHQIYFYNESIKDERSFMSDIQHVFRSNWHTYFVQDTRDVFSTYNWVNFSKGDFVKLGYKFVNNTSFSIHITDEAINEDFNDIDLSSVNVRTNLYKDDTHSNFCVFDALIFNEFESYQNCRSNLFIHNAKTADEFETDVKEFIKLNPIISVSYILYLEELVSFMVLKGYKSIPPIYYFIPFSPRENYLPNCWEEILGNELFSKTKALLSTLK